MKITPFTFESFGGDKPASPSLAADVLDMPEEEVVAEEIIEPSFNQEELDAAKQQAYDDGFLAGKKEGIREAEQTNQQHLEVLNGVTAHINEKLVQLQADYTKTLKKRQAELGKLVMTCAEKIAGEALRKDPVSDIVDMIDNCLSGLFDSPELIAKVHPEIAPLLKDKLPDTVTIEVDDTLKLSDCLLNWKHGQAMRDTATLWGEIETIIERHFVTKSIAEEVPVEATLEAPKPVKAAPAAAPEPTATDTKATQVRTPATPVQNKPNQEIPSVTNKIETKGENHE